MIDRVLPRLGIRCRRGEADWHLCAGNNDLSLISYQRLTHFHFSQMRKRLLSTEALERPFERLRFSRTNVERHG